LLVSIDVCFLLAGTDLFSDKPSHWACVKSMSITMNTTASQQVDDERLSGLVDAVTQGNMRAVHMLLLQAPDAGLSVKVFALGPVNAL
jgi:hypothetical protein